MLRDQSSLPASLITNMFMKKFKGTTEQAFVTATSHQKVYKFVFNLDINN